MAQIVTNPTAKQARIAVLMMFFVNGVLIANWVSRIPQFKESMQLGDGPLGLVLLGLSAGVLTALSLVGSLVARYGSKRVTVAAAVVLCFLLTILGWMPNPVLLWINLFLFGMALSTMDVAMNAQAVEVEALARRPLMSTFHASFSVGGFVGAAIGAGMAGAAIEPKVHFLVSGFGFLLLILVSRHNLLPTQPALSDEEHSPVFQLPPRALWSLGVVAFAGAVGEGAMADWSGVYLSDVVQTDAGIAALGFAAFSITMTIGRLLGDNLTTRFSEVPLVRAGGLIATLGLLLAILVPQPITALIGFGLVGLGVSTVVPLAFSAAGRLPGIPASAGIAGVATIGYAGFLAGPPVIGLLADSTSLQVALLLVALLTASLMLTARSLRRAAPHE